MALPKGKSLSAMRAKMQKEPEEEEEKLSGPKLSSLLAEVDGSLDLDPEAQELVLRMTDEFVERVTKRAAEYAKHRNSATLDAVDLRLSLERHWGIYVPGLAAPKRQAWTYRRPNLNAKKQRKNPPPGVVVVDGPQQQQRYARASPQP